MDKINNIKIMNLEAAEVLKNNYDGISITKDYRGVFANSLLSNKLESIGLKVTKGTTKDIIMMNFKYGYTPKSTDEIEIITKKDKIKDNIKVKKVLIETRKIQKNNAEKKPFTFEIDKLANDIKVFKAEIKVLDKNIEDGKINKDAIRDILYVDGFKLDFYKKNKSTKEYYKAETINYTFWFRSPSKSKTGSVCFINKELHEEINDWQTMGIKLPDKDAKLVEMEAYKSLTSSNIESEITINPFTEILVVNDLDSYIDEMCSKVYISRIPSKLIKTYKIIKCPYAKIIGHNLGKSECRVKNGVMKIKNTIYDGMALLSDELFTGSNGMMVLRQHFYKACGFRTFISKFMKQWCLDNGKDYNAFTVKDRYSREVFVKNIKMICTENSMKWEKFQDLGINYEYWCERVQADDNVFGVCKIDHKSKYLKYQRMSFQMVGTLPIDAEKSFELCKDTIEYTNSLKDDNEEFIKHLERTKSDLNANEMIIDLYNNNIDFYNSELFRKFKTKTISEYKETLRAGKLLTNSDNLTIAGNPYSLLLHSVGALNKYIKGNVIEGYEDPTLPTLPENEGVSVFTTRFDNEELCAFRSPHNSPNNIMFFKNLRTNPLMDEYFNFSKNIIAVDLFNTNCQSRGNGFDEDSDFVYVTNNSVCIQGAKDAQKFNTIENCIPQTGKTYNNTMLDLSKIDNGLAKSKYSIGLSSNLAMLAMSWYWSTPTQELKDIVCITSILAQCSIDNSKRTYKVDLEKEIDRISNLDCMKVKINNKKEMVLVNPDSTAEETKTFKKLKLAKPYFWKFIKTIKEKQAKKINEKDESKKQQLIIMQKQKNSKEKAAKVAKLNEHCIEAKICPMDYIQDAIDTIKANTDNTPYTADIDFVQDIKGKSREKQENKVVEIVTDLDNMYKKHFDEKDNNKNIDDEDWEVEQQIKSQDAIVNIKKIILSPKTMQMIITHTLSDHGANKKYKRRMLNCLYKSQKDLFLSVFKSN